MPAENPETHLTDMLIKARAFRERGNDQRAKSKMGPDADCYSFMNIFVIKSARFKAKGRYPTMHIMHCWIHMQFCEYRFLAAL